MCGIGAAHAAGLWCHSDDAGPRWWGGGGGGGGGRAQSPAVRKATWSRRGPSYTAERAKRGRPAEGVDATGQPLYGTRWVLGATVGERRRSWINTPNKSNAWLQRGLEHPCGPFEGAAIAIRGGSHHYRAPPPSSRGDTPPRRRCQPVARTGSTSRMNSRTITVPSAGPRGGRGGLLVVLRCRGVHMLTPNVQVRGHYGKMCGLAV